MYPDLGPQPQMDRTGRIVLNPMTSRCRAMRQLVVCSSWLGWQGVRPDFLLGMGDLRVLLASLMEDPIWTAYGDLNFGMCRCRGMQVAASSILNLLPSASGRFRV